MTYPCFDAIELDANSCFARSRRLTGMNRYFDGPAAILETRGPLARDAAALQRWEEVARTISRALWSDEAALCPHLNAQGAELLIRCPQDQLFTATEVNEFAWEVAALGDDDRPCVDGFDRAHRFGDDAAAQGYFARLAAAEREPALRELASECTRRAVPLFIDDDAVSIGAGHRSRTFANGHVPRIRDVDWAALGGIPVALVTGSNGKTTTTRLIAAMLDRGREEWAGRVGFCGTEGIVIGGQWIERGDYSGPAGARTVLRDGRVTAAVLETARGGILRRGLAVEYADVAVVTNIAADHFGEYGIDSLDDIAEAKLSVARPLGKTGMLVANADDAVLMRHVEPLGCGKALFSLGSGSNAVLRHLASGGLACVVRGGELLLERDTWRASLGPIADMPLSIGGAADYNVANLAAAALAAHVLQVPVECIREVAHRFGRDRADNPGRFERWNIGGCTVVLDYAHNPDGLARLLRVCRTLLGDDGRLLLLLGQAGNREDADIRELARVAASFQPHRIVIKELPGFLRGRAPGEVPALLRGALEAARFNPAQVGQVDDEAAAALELLAAGRPGDVVVLPVHQKAAREDITRVLDNKAIRTIMPGS